MSTAQEQLDQEIDRNGSPWEEDIFKDNEDMRTVKNSILTLNASFKVKCFSRVHLLVHQVNLVSSLTFFFETVISGLCHR
jgi:hypothetical protein